MITWLLLMVLINDVSATYIKPTVELKSCLTGVITLSITNMTSGGYVYIRSDSAYNILPTIDGSMVYTCSFQECALEYDEKFFLIIQKRTSIQTGDDSVVPVLCLSDTGTLFAMDLKLGDETENNVTTFRFKPTAELQFFRNESALDPGSTVKLGTEVDMVIEVTNNFDDYIDISVRWCTADMISLIEDRCSVDEDLFGPFTHDGVGRLTTRFNMFRPTTTVGGAYLLLFSCRLEVCRESCPQYACNETSSQSERRKRDADLDENESLYVGTTLNVVQEDTTTGPPIAENPVCIPSLVFIAAIGGFGILLTASSTAAVYLTLQYILSSNQSKEVKNAVKSDEKKVTRSLSQLSVQQMNAPKEDLTNDTMSLSQKDQSYENIGCEDEVKPRASSMLPGNNNDMSNLYKRGVYCPSATLPSKGLRKPTKRPLQLSQISILKNEARYCSVDQMSPTGSKECLFDGWQRHGPNDQ